MDSNNKMVDKLTEKGYIETDQVEKAFRDIDRAKFTPETYSKWAYKDRPIPLMEGATLSAPSMVAINTELLNIGEDDVVVEIGSGSGYQLTILSELCRKAYGVEIIPELVEKSREILEGVENIEIIHGSGFQPLEKKGVERVDRILYSCAINSLDEAENYLKSDGVAVAPVNSDSNQILTKLDSKGKTFHGPVRFIPYIDE